MAEVMSAAVPASGSSFYTAMRILPYAKRQAMFEIYAFCRAVDDIADAQGPRATRLAELRAWRADVEALFAGRPPAHLQGLAAATSRFDLRREDFTAIIDGMEMDAASDMRGPDAATLDLYCDRVASAVGRLCVRVFGMEETAGKRLAHHLGRALQLTNILRDLDEDASLGRLYLPREALDRAGIHVVEPNLVLMNPELGMACAFVIDMAREHFRQADQVMAASPRSVVRAPRIMAEAYKSVLAKLIRRGWSAPRTRIRISRPLLLWIVARHALF
jgi:presqualene diphosphate synthase